MNFNFDILIGKFERHDEISRKYEIKEDDATFYKIFIKKTTYPLSTFGMV